VAYNETTYKQRNEMSNRTFIQIAIVVTVIAIHRKNKRLAEARARQQAFTDAAHDYTNLYFDTRSFY